ncbi:hypothetical protein D3C75_1245270 [compost metagenome]
MYVSFLPSGPEGILQSSNLLYDQPLDIRIMHEVLMHLDFAGLNAILQIMRGIRDIIAEIHQLGFQRFLPVRNPPLAADG